MICQTFHRRSATRILGPTLRLLGGWMLLVLCLPAWGQVDAEQFRRDLSALTAVPSRIVGSPGYQQAAEYLQSQIRQLPDVELRTHEFKVTVPVTKEAILELPGGRTEPIYPFWPAQIRANTTPAEGITGRLVYLGDAKDPTQIKPAALDGNIAVLDADAGDYWRQAPYFGARAVLILGQPDTNNQDLRAHELVPPVNIPRFYVPIGSLADQLRSGTMAEPVTLKSTVHWETRVAQNIYALVTARDPQAAKGTPALMFSIPYDASGLVPDLAVGASQAVQTASGLALLRQFAAEPADRTLLFFFSGGDSVNFLATRNMFMAFSDPPAVWREKLEDVNERVEEAKRDLIRLRELVSDPTKIVPTRDRAVQDRIIKLVETDAFLDQDELFRIRKYRDDEKTDAMRQREDELQMRQIALSRLRFSFQQKPHELAEPDQAPVATQFVQRTIERLDGVRTEEGFKPGLLQALAERQRELETRIALYQWLADELGRNADPDARSNNSRLLESLVALDLSDRGGRVGPMYRGSYFGASNISHIQNYRDWFSTRQRAFDEGKPEAAWFDKIDELVEFGPLSGTQNPHSWMVADMAVGSELCQYWGVPGFAMMTLDDLRLFRDTPNDTPDRIDLDIVLPQLQAVSTLFEHALNDPKFRERGEYQWQTRNVSGQVVSSAPGRPVPDLPREGFLISMWPGNVSGLAEKRVEFKWLPYTMGVRRGEVRTTDAEGGYYFEGLPRHGDDDNKRQFAVLAYKLAPDGSVIGASDLGKQSGEIKLAININNDPGFVRSLTFPCTEFSIFGLYDPRFLQNLGEVSLLDARRNAVPQRYDVQTHDQMLTAFLEPNMQVYLLFRYGRVGNRLLLINMEEPGDSGAMALAGDQAVKKAQGFTVPQLRDLGPLALRTAVDFWRLNAVRLRQYATAGVSNGLLDDLHAEAAEQIQAAEAAFAADDGSGMMKHATGAWANEARVYYAAQAMAQDVVRAAIFLLLLCVPFSFCMERLLIGTPNIYKQILYTLIIFSVMTAALASFHPAFKISASPLIIILAFAIILMSVIVIFVVYSRFDSELKKIRSGRGNAQSASFARASVLASAVLLGIANMRKRKFRTALTAITIVLITFAVLCFTSATRYLDTTTLPTGEASKYPGILMRQRGFRPMPASIRDSLRAVLPGQRIVERWWNVNAGDPKDQLNVVTGGMFEGGAAVADASGVMPTYKPLRTFAAQAALGLTPGESALSEIDEVIGPAFARLEAGEERIIFLSRTAAEQLDVRAGDEVRVGGISLEVAAVFDPNAFDQRVRMLSGEPIAPLKYITGALDASGQKLTDSWSADHLDVGQDESKSELASSYEHLSGSQIVILPAELAQMLPNASLRNVAIRLKDEAEVKAVSDELAKRFAVAMFAGFDNGVKMVAASNLSSVSGAGQVAIPLAIAGLIIFNTMMGSIAERRREIHVYTSLGLAPLHVGALFVAEAMTYGLIGTVFGYVVGQGVGTLLSHLDLLGDVTLNYSGSSAMMTMGLILVIVLLSALVPARVASKIAAPSIDRTWKVPLPKGDEIVATLPFTINKTAADGALAYLAEFFDAHQEGSIGKFSAGKVDAFGFEDESGRPSRGLKTVIWLTPFDLGVRQHLMLLIHPGEYQDIYEVQLHLQRLSGDDSSWYRMNRSFLTELRKQFLQWRSLSPQRMLDYVEESKSLFREVPEEVVATMPGEAVRLA